jgi:hypothetical protein
MACPHSLIPVCADQVSGPLDLKRSGWTGSTGTDSIKWIDLIHWISIERTRESGKEPHRGGLGFVSPAASSRYWNWTAASFR